MNTKIGLILYPEHIRVARGLLSDSEAGQLLFALFDYTEKGILPRGELSKAWSVCFNLLREDVDANARRYEETCKKNRNNAHTRWQKQDATACDGMPADTSAYDRIPSNTNDANRTERNRTELNGNEGNVEKSKRARFAPPTPEDVRAYCQEKGYAVDANSFCDFYASKGWKVGNTPMKDWRAAVRTWAHKDKNELPPLAIGRKTFSVPTEIL